MVADGKKRFLLTITFKPSILISPMTNYSSVWVVLHNGQPVCAYRKRSASIDAIVRALSLRKTFPVPARLVRQTLVRCGAIYLPCEEKWSVESIYFMD